MLLNNFKYLLYFGNPNVQFKNVKGELVDFSGYCYTSSGSGTQNGYSIRNSVRSFFYDPNRSGVNLVDEQTSYVGGIVNNGVNTYNYPYFILFVGTGDTPVTIDDYKLAAPISLQVNSHSCLQPTAGRIVVTRQFINNTEEAVTIKEIGLYLGSTKRQYTDEAVPFIMLGRKVLDSPVTLQVGDSYSFDYNIDMSQISFSEADS